MKTQIRTSYRLALLLAMGILTAMVALGMFSGFNSPVNAGTQSQGGITKPSKVTSTVAGIAVANDGTIFAWGDSAHVDDRIQDDIFVSTDGGSSFTVIESSGEPWNGTAIVEIVPSPQFGSDSNLFLAAGRIGLPFDDPRRGRRMEPHCRHRRNEHG